MRSDCSTLLFKMALLKAPLVAAAIVLALATGPLFKSQDTSPGAAPQSAAGKSLPPLPSGWPATLQLGTSDSPGGATKTRSIAPFAFRYQYLAGGVNTNNGWQTWNENGSFVSHYIKESDDAGITPVFTYYMLYQSAPGNTKPESLALSTNLQNTDTMTAYYNDLKVFFQRAGLANTPVVLHVEPDLWGYLQQQSDIDLASTVTARVASTGIEELSGLPENVAGFAEAIVRLRNKYAANVLLAYHLSAWGTGEDLTYTDPPDDRIRWLANRSAAFYYSLNANFDLTFAEFSDRDAAFKDHVYGDHGASWWDASDFARNVLFLQTFVAVTQKRVVIWQVPFGNTKMRAENNTWNHFQDNKVEWLLDEPNRTHLDAYVRAGVIAFLFGRGADGATCACDTGDGVTNPAAINGNVIESFNSDDDGGFFHERAAAYYRDGVILLEGR